ncbi:hypothetical protein DVU_0368 [Nitratidesulfovibrio vulgaris str. Hildenborough]|uniref:Uncharacterized protein n=1 Tax=Nitratidesulfovibrio vulgaris (strain ATCC 29579 / DSM 644 / CCUG 34227 / NCIMB 8303 / VKM B-1760 / Hildenborough) TaxID=882 RepID=Q72F47_NITV2|nr:hypothetical protein DVU_0368 [Nitratidesulfovibrio vulgaris str. Hildenborough]
MGVSSVSLTEGCEGCVVAERAAEGNRSPESVHFW